MLLVLSGLSADFGVEFHNLSPGSFRFLFALGESICSHSIALFSVTEKYDSCKKRPKTQGRKDDGQMMQGQKVFTNCSQAQSSYHPGENLKTAAPVAGRSLDDSALWSRAGPHLNNRTQ